MGSNPDSILISFFFFKRSGHPGYVMVHLGARFFVPIYVPEGVRTGCLFTGPGFRFSTGRVPLNFLFLNGQKVPEPGAHRYKLFAHALRYRLFWSQMKEAGTGRVSTAYIIRISWTVCVGDVFTAQSSSPAVFFT